MNYYLPFDKILKLNTNDCVIYHNIYHISNLTKDISLHKKRLLLKSLVMPHADMLGPIALLFGGKDKKVMILLGTVLTFFVLFLLAVSSNVIGCRRVIVTLHLLRFPLILKFFRGSEGMSLTPHIVFLPLIWKLVFISHSFMEF